MATSIDDEQFAAMLAAARLAKAGLAPATAPYRQHPPAAAVDVALPPACLHPLVNPAGICAQCGTCLTIDSRAGRCRAGCGIPLNPALIDRAADMTGLHANCQEPPLPPSTLAEMRHALNRFEASRPRTVQTTLGPSELGTPCDRQIALKLAGVQRHERDLPWAPMCGTAVHGLMEEVLRAENERLGRERWIIEQKVMLDDELSGHGDAFDTDWGMVVDWKYTGTTARRKASRRNVPNDQLVSAEYRTQAHLYGLGHRNAGRPVRFVRLVLLARSHDYAESVEWTEEYREDIAVNAMTRFYNIRDRVTELHGWAAAFPERLADIPATPGEACKWCPFRRHTPPGGAPVDKTGCEGDLASKYDPAAFLK
jgi:hypothetical protein